MIVLTHFVLLAAGLIAPIDGPAIALRPDGAAPAPSVSVASGRLPQLCGELRRSAICAVRSVTAADGTLSTVSACQSLADGGNRVVDLGFPLLLGTRAAWMAGGERLFVLIGPYGGPGPLALPGPPSFTLYGLPLGYVAPHSVVPAPTRVLSRLEAVFDRPVRALYRGQERAGPLADPGGDNTGWRDTEPVRLFDLIERDDELLVVRVDAGVLSFWYRPIEYNTPDRSGLFRQEAPWLVRDECRLPATDQAFHVLADQSVLWLLTADGRLWTTPAKGMAGRALFEAWAAADRRLRATIIDHDTHRSFVFGDGWYLDLGDELKEVKEPADQPWPRPDEKASEIDKLLVYRGWVDLTDKPKQP